VVEPDGQARPAGLFVVKFSTADLPIFDDNDCLGVGDDVHRFMGCEFHDVSPCDIWLKNSWKTLTYVGFPATSSGDPFQVLRKGQGYLHNPFNVLEDGRFCSQVFSPESYSENP
jgi:hypothetical protein